MTLPDDRLALMSPFCRMQMPGVDVAWGSFRDHAERTYHLFAKKSEQPVSGPSYLDQLYTLDWYLCCGCLDGDRWAWEVLFSAKTGRSDCLLIDALRGRAARLFPGDEERQETAVTEFWGHLLVPENENSTSVLSRYDGQRPLVPWLIRVFQNRHLSKLRKKGEAIALPDEEVAMPLPEVADPRWHESFVGSAREWLGTLNDAELVVLGLRWRYRLSQREVAGMLKIHEGNVTRRFDKLRQRCVDYIGEQLREQGWTGDDLAGFVWTEMGSILTDDPRLSADHLAGLLRDKGLEVPQN